MTRRSGTSRVTTPGGEQETAQAARRYPSLRQRNPVAYWIAIVSVVAMVLSTVVVSASAFF